ncbi:OmpA family protein [Elioraea thermophila]|uniref:OmpA family protein n=1 Tax=Elioraea thermophila TaxID=2185104 RepID=UPI001E567BB1|nr:OmpA family protein [Elioraea thermophila]
MAWVVRASAGVMVAAALAAAAAARDGPVRVDRSVLDSLGPPPPAPRAPAEAPRASGLPLAAETLSPTPDTRPQPQRPVRRPVQPAAPPTAAAPPNSPAPLPLPPEAVAPPPVRAEAVPPLPLPPPLAEPPPRPVAAVPAAPMPTAPSPVPAQPPAPAVGQAAAAPPTPSAPAAPPPVRVVRAPGTLAPLRLLFAGDSQDLTPAMRADLKALAAALPEDETVRLTINAYAGGDPANPSVARRLSLSRALAVRAALMEEGVRATRIDVRALGLAAGEGPPDRVDILIGGSRS